MLLFPTDRRLYYICCNLIWMLCNKNSHVPSYKITLTSTKKRKKKNNPSVTLLIHIAVNITYPTLYSMRDTTNIVRHPWNSISGKSRFWTNFGCFLSAHEIERGRTERSRRTTKGQFTLKVHWEVILDETGRTRCFSKVFWYVFILPF
jgi:hypothetical protein